MFILSVLIRAKDRNFILSHKNVNNAVVRQYFDLDKRYIVSLCVSFSG